MSSWGVKLLGFNSVLNFFKDVQMRLDDNAVYVVGTNVEYAVFQEFGTRNMSAQPYLFPAARQVAREADRVAGDASSVEEAVKRLAFQIEREAKDRAPVDTGNLRSSIRAERVR